MQSRSFFKNPPIAKRRPPDVRLLRWLLVAPSAVLMLAMLWAIFT